MTILNMEEHYSKIKATQYLIKTADNSKNKNLFATRVSLEHEERILPRFFSI